MSISLAFNEVYSHTQNILLLLMDMSVQNFMLVPTKEWLQIDSAINIFVDIFSPIRSLEYKFIEVKLQDAHESKMVKERLWAPSVKANGEGINQVSFKWHVPT